MFLASKDALHVVSSKKKCAMFEQLKQADGVGEVISTHVRSKEETGEAQIAAAVQALGLTAETTVAALAKESPEGVPAQEWAKALQEAGCATVEAAEGLSQLMQVKDAAELLHEKKAAHLSAMVLTNFVVPKLEEIIDVQKEVSHSALTEQTEEVVLAPSKASVKLRADKCEVAYPPIFQSGGTYQFKYSAVSEESNLHAGVIVCMLGTRYSMYCANLVRTYLVDPSKPQERAYKAMLDAQKAAIGALKPGAKCSDVHAAAKKALEEADAELAAKLPKSVGAGIGIEFRDASLSLNAKNSTELKAGMAFNVQISLTGLENPTASNAQARSYGLMVADTVLIKQEGEAEVITLKAGKEWGDVAYEISEEAEADKDVVAGGKSAILDTQLRAQGDTGEGARHSTQLSLLDQKNQETYARLSKANEQKEKAATAKLSRADKVAYRRVADIPAKMELELQVDQRNEAVLLPIRGLLVPFHISTVKNISVHNEGAGAYVHFHFNVPGSAFGSSYLPAQKYPDLTFVREATFRSTDGRHAAQVVQQVKTLRKQVLDKEKEKTERENLVTQEKLKVSQGRVFRLGDLSIRPTFGGRGKKVSGTLEAHSNGFRYRNPKGEVCDVIYSNIKHAFLQPSTNEPLVLVHFHLHHPIIINKKKTQDVQFYREVVDMSQALDGKRSNAYDPDELDEEQREREKRNRANREFQEFTRKVQELWERTQKSLELEFDVPYRELAFQGVPHKESVTVTPSVGCLVSLMDPPFFVLSLDDVELVNIERVGFGLKNFDLTVVFKDFAREVHRIDAIPTTSLESIKEWLNQMQIKYYESKMNLAWKPILKTIVDDPEKFLEEGGWEFLNMEGGSDDEDESEDESEGFVPSEDEESEEGSGSDFDEDEEEDSEEEPEDDYEEGMDWDELEDEARRDDAEKGRDEHTPQKGKRKPSGGGGGSSKKYRR